MPVVEREQGRLRPLGHGIYEEPFPHREFPFGCLYQCGLDALVGEFGDGAVVPVVSVPQGANAMGQCGEVLVARANRVQDVQGDVQFDGVRAQLLQLRDVIPPRGSALLDGQVVVRRKRHRIHAHELGQSRLDLPFGHGPNERKGLHAQRRARGEVVVQGVD